MVFHSKNEKFNSNSSIYASPLKTQFGCFSVFSILNHILMLTSIYRIVGNIKTKIGRAGNLVCRPIQNFFGSRNRAVLSIYKDDIETGGGFATIYNMSNQNNDGFLKNRSAKQYRKDSVINQIACFIGRLKKRACRIIDSFDRLVKELLGINKNLLPMHITDIYGSTSSQKRSKQLPLYHGESFQKNRGVFFAVINMIIHIIMPVYIVGFFYLFINFVYYI